MEDVLTGLSLKSALLLLQAILLSTQHLTAFWMHKRHAVQREEGFVVLLLMKHALQEIPLKLMLLTLQLLNVVELNARNIVLWKEPCSIACLAMIDVR
jgi:hypothetical protein